jgi:hypothetical protein
VRGRRRTRSPPQADVEQHGVRAPAPERRERGGQAIGLRDDRVAARLEDIARDLPEPRMVVDDEDAR